jgi:hypothetical protein
MAGPFDLSDFAQLVPPDEKLNPEWVKSLFDRGESTVYRGEFLALIGMPVGGICAGQLYLGGDGKLWHWDTFNRVEPTNEGLYANPMRSKSRLDHGFVLRIKHDGKSEIRTLDRSGFADVSFRGEYPIGIAVSQPFTIERSYLNFLIGGGKHLGRTCINLKLERSSPVRWSAP